MVVLDEEVKKQTVMVIWWLFQDPSSEGKQRLVEVGFCGCHFRRGALKAYFYAEVKEPVERGKWVA